MYATLCCFTYTNSTVLSICICVYQRFSTHSSNNTAAGYWSVCSLVFSILNSDHIEISVFCTFTVVRYTLGILVSWDFGCISNYINFRSISVWSVNSVRSVSIPWLVRVYSVTYWPTRPLQYTKYGYFISESGSMLLHYFLGVFKVAQQSFVGKKRYSRWSLGAVIALPGVRWLGAKYTWTGCTHKRGAHQQPATIHRHYTLRRVCGHPACLQNHSTYIPIENPRCLLAFC